jgi:hypothetical protein
MKDQNKRISIWGIVAIVVAVLTVIIGVVCIVRRKSKPSHCDSEFSISNNHGETRQITEKEEQKEKQIKTILIYKNDSVASPIEVEFVKKYGEKNGYSVRVISMAPGRKHCFYMPDDFNDRNTVKVFTGYGRLCDGRKEDSFNGNSIMFAKTSPMQIFVGSAEEINKTGDSPDNPRKLCIVKGGPMEEVFAGQPYQLNSSKNIVYAVDGKYIQILSTSDRKKMINDLQNGDVHGLLVDGFNAAVFVSELKNGGSVTEIFTMTIKKGFLLQNAGACSEAYHAFLLNFAEYIRSNSGRMIEDLRRKIDAKYITIDSTPGTIGDGAFESDEEHPEENDNPGTIGDGAFESDEEHPEENDNPGTIGDGAFEGDEEHPEENDNPGTIGDGAFEGDEEHPEENDNPGTIGDGAFEGDEEHPEENDNPGTIGDGAFEGDEEHPEENDNPGTIGDGAFEGDEDGDDQYYYGDDDEFEGDEGGDDEDYYGDDDEFEDDDE